MYTFAGGVHCLLFIFQISMAVEGLGKGPMGLIAPSICLHHSFVSPVALFNLFLESIDFFGAIGGGVREVPYCPLSAVLVEIQMT